jgi:hypothetical protein
LNELITLVGRSHERGDTPNGLGESPRPRRERRDATITTTPEPTEQLCLGMRSPTERSGNHHTADCYDRSGT